MGSGKCACNDEARNFAFMADSATVKPEAELLHAYWKGIPDTLKAEEKEGEKKEKDSGE